MTRWTSLRQWLANRAGDGVFALRWRWAARTWKTWVALGLLPTLIGIALALDAGFWLLRHSSGKQEPAHGRLSWTEVAMAQASPADQDAAFAWAEVLLPQAGDNRVNATVLRPRQAGAPSWYLWRPQQTQAIRLSPPLWLQADVLQQLRLDRSPLLVLQEVKPFHHGMAAVRVGLRSWALQEVPEWSLWGYINAEGRWLVPPRYLEAHPFVNNLALVVNLDRSTGWIRPDGSLWPAGFGSPQAHQLTKHPDASQIRRPTAYALDPTHTLVRDKIAANFCSGSWLVQPQQVRLLDSCWTELSGDGALSVTYQTQSDTSPPGLERYTVRRLNSPQPPHHIDIPPNGRPPYPLADNRLLLRGANEHTITDASGQKVFGPVTEVTPLTAQRWWVCQPAPQPSPTPPQALSPQPGMLRPANTHTVCGVLTPEGRWWMPPPLTSLTRVSAGRALVTQAGATSQPVPCWLALQDESAHCTPATEPLPVLRPGSTQPPRYRYQHPGPVADSWAPWEADDGLTQAGLFIGELALVEWNGLPGLLNRQGRQLAPVPTDVDPLLGAYQRVRVKDQAKQGGLGLINRNGQWQVLPMFEWLIPRPEGGFIACAWDVPPNRCIHLNAQGQLGTPLPAAQIQAEISAFANAQTRQDPDTRVPVRPDEGAPEPVGVNSLWGYQDPQGRWVVPAVLAEADPFVNGLARVAVRPYPEDQLPEAGSVVSADTAAPSEDSPADDATETTALHWGVIDRSGHWVVPPSYAAIQPLNGEVIRAQDHDQAWVLLDTQGQALPVQDEQFTLDERPADEQGWRLARVGERYGFVNAQMAWVLEPRFHDLAPFHQNLAPAKGPLDAGAGLSGQHPNAWITTAITRLPDQGLLLLSARQVKPVGVSPQELERRQRGAQALALDSGHWLVPQNSHWLWAWWDDLWQRIAWLWRQA